MRKSAGRVRALIGAVFTVVVLASACSSDSPADEEAEADTSTPATSPSTTTEAPTTAPPPDTVVDEGMSVREIVEALASDELTGRDNQTPGSAAAQEMLVAELAQFAEPVFPDESGDNGYLQPYDLGTNILGIIPGGDLADEFVLIGAHYDHLGSDCAGVSAADDICNGATDNATGVAAALEVARSIAADGAPRRSIIVALWDGEEDGLVGSKAYVDAQVVPLDQTVAYVNFDIQGLNLLPSLANATVLVGAETGGPNLVESASRAAEAATLDTVMLSLLFGQGRSDHAVLAAAGVPSVFFTDANSGCYHTVNDDIDAVDFAKLDQQIATAEALSRDLVATDDVPVFDPAAPPSTYNDAAELLRIISVAEPDFVLFGAEQRASSEQYLIDLQGVVDAGPEAFDEAANLTLLTGAVEFVSAIAATECDPFIS